MMDFAQIDTGTSYQPQDDMRLAYIRDAFPDGVQEAVIWQAFTAEFCNKLSNYKSRPHLLRYWFGATVTLREIAEQEPEMFLDIVNHFQERLDALT